MIRKSLMILAAAGFLSATAMAADVVVRVAPPRPMIERRTPPPSRAHIWTSGYHRWDGHAYVWVPGAWVLPPRPHARWIPAHWVRRGHEWIFIEGHWR